MHSIKFLTCYVEITPDANTFNMQLRSSIFVILSFLIVLSLTLFMPISNFVTQGYQYTRPSNVQRSIAHRRSADHNNDTNETNQLKCNNGKGNAISSGRYCHRFYNLAKHDECVFLTKNLTCEHSIKVVSFI